MEIQKFGKILRNNVRINVEELLKSFLHYFYFRIIEYPRNKVFSLLSELYKVFHRSELLLSQLLVIKHLEALIIENCAPAVLDIDKFRVNFPNICDKSLEVLDTMLMDKLTEFLLLVSCGE